MKLIVLAGGGPKQLGVIYYSHKSRSLVKILDKTLLGWILNGVRTTVSSSRDIVVVSDDPKVMEYCETKGYSFVRQEQTGIEAALCYGLLSLHLAVDEQVTVVYGDIYTPDDIVLNHIKYASTIEDVTISVVLPKLIKPSFLRLNVDLATNTVTTVGKGSYTFAGVLTAPAGLLRRSICKDGYTIPELLKRLVDMGKLRAHVWLNPWVDVDTPWDYMIATRLALEKTASREGLKISSSAKVSERATLEPPIIVLDEARIEPGAVIRGPAFISVGALIGAHSFIRPYSVVLESSTVGSFTEFKRSIAYRGALISSHCYIADSIIGENAHVGAYTITLNVPYTSIPDYIKVTTSIPLEEFKIGSVIARRSNIRPYSRLEPAKVYEVIN